MKLYAFWSVILSNMCSIYEDQIIIADCGLIYLQEIQPYLIFPFFKGTSIIDGNQSRRYIG